MPPWVACICSNKELSKKLPSMFQCIDKKIQSQCLSLSIINHWFYKLFSASFPSTFNLKSMASTEKHQQLKDEERWPVIQEGVDKLIKIIEGDKSKSFSPED